MNKAALFFDVGGTLIDEQTKIVPESTLRALKQARKTDILCLSIQVVHLVIHWIP